MTGADFIDKRVLVVITLPPVEGTVTATRRGVNGRLWLTISTEGDEREHTLGEVIFL